MIDLRDKLNPAQLTAVTTTDGPLLVIAGAGSGKTRVIEYRVLHLLQSGVSPSSILLLTFTRRAAREMISRSSQHEAGARYVDGGTFHSFAYRTIKKYHSFCGLSPVFTVMDEDDSTRALQSCLAKFETLSKDKRFPKKDSLRRIISMAANKQLGVDEVIGRFYPQFADFYPDIDLIRRKYAEFKSSYDLLDYDDLLVYLKALLEKDEIRKKVSGQYRFIMVDEYQDTNRLQGDIAFLIAKDHGNIMAVGDDAQSIYGFRGASHENIMAFPKMFSGCRVIALEENYRSSQQILNMANAVLDNMRDKYCKKLFSASERQGQKPRLQAFANSHDEARWIASKIQELQGLGVSLGDQGVLFRSEYVSIPLQAELTKRGMPYQVFGGLKFYETAHVKDILAHLRVLVNPKDAPAWMRVLTLVEGVGPRTAEQIIKNMSLYPSLFEMIEDGLAKYVVHPKYGTDLKLLQDVLREAASQSLGALDKFEEIADYYIPIMRTRFDDWNMRANDLDALTEIFERQIDLDELLAELAIDSPQKNSSRYSAAGSGVLTLSTVHSAKGLEWEVVFLPGLADGVLPVSFALDDENDIEEEHRIFYVAITRAKSALFISMSQETVRSGKSQINKISRFLTASEVLERMEHNVSVIYAAHDDRNDGFDVPEHKLSDKMAMYRRLMDYI